MKAALRGRALDIGLAEGTQAAAQQLQLHGFTADRADNVATAALKYAEEETEQLTRQLTPRSVWPGLVVIRRHLIDRREESYLLLKYHSQDQGWRLDSALFS